MPSKHRFRIFAALSVVFVIILAPQLAGAGSESITAGSAVATVHHHHRHHHHRPAPTPVPDPVPVPIAVPDPVPVPNPVPAPDPIPVPVPVPDPIPVPTPTASECLAQHPVVVAGVQTSKFKPSVSGHLAVDARTASWTQVDPWPVTPTGSGSICWNGGSIVGTWTMDTVWDVFHHTGGFNFANPNSVIENVRVHNYGDAINVRDGASNWTVRGAHTSFIHDDCLQDDYLNSGVISDSLFDGCYVGISTRPSSNNTTSDGRNNTLTMNGDLLRLQPMPTVYKGPAPGHGGFFKWDDTGRSPSLSLHNNVFRVDQTPNHGSLGLPAGYRVECSGNTIVWLGSGAFPEAASWLAKCPDTQIVTTKSTWDNAVTICNALH